MEYLLGLKRPLTTVGKRRCGANMIMLYGMPRCAPSVYQNSCE